MVKFLHCGRWRYIAPLSVFFGPVISSCYQLCPVFQVIWTLPVILPILQLLAIHFFQFSKFILSHFFLNQVLNFRYLYSEMIANTQRKPIVALKPSLTHTTSPWQTSLFPSPDFAGSGCLRSKRCCFFKAILPGCQRYSCLLSWTKES